ncbi:MAG: hypothetical protein PVG90_05820, partial [Bacillota bacterium]
MTKLWEADLKSFFGKFGNKQISNWFLLGIIALGLIFLIGGERKEVKDARTPESLSNQTGSDPEAAREPTAEIQLEQEITRILSRIVGVGSVQVDISLKTTRRNLWERQTRVSKRVSQQNKELNTEESSSDEL